MNPLGLPRAMTGAFASVYRLQCESNDWAVRCFLHNIADQSERYARLSEYIGNDDLIYTVGFKYIADGIKVLGERYPVLKMEWVEGASLDQYLRQYGSRTGSVEMLLDRFCRMSSQLGAAGIAHGDLQHGNILVVDDDLRLVDYDGMFVPALSGYKSNELGHPNYQHPRRTPRHFGPFLDNFSIWVIYASLFCLLRDPDLWARLNGGDECLLFRRSDFKNPIKSHCFAVLENHRLPEIRNISEIIRSLIEYPIKQIPPLDTSIRTADDLPPADTAFEDPDDIESFELADAKEKKSMRLSRLTNLPDWMKPGEATISAPRPLRTIGPWPQFRHYREAITKCAESFHDPELKNGVPVLAEYGSGPNGVVFHIRCLTRRIAVKCFYKHVEDRQARYEEISKAIVGATQQYFLEFEYQPEGIKVGNYWYPILKMEWQRGFSLAQCADFYRGDGNLMRSLQERFRLMMWALHQAGIAHGDLHPDNILIAQNEFKLVDYDTMYVPAFAGMKSHEAGMPNFQHPGRALEHFGPYLDNYPAWIIDTLLLLVSTGYYDLFCLVMKRLEYVGDDSSWAFKFLDWHPHPLIRDRVRLLKKFRQGNIEDVPPVGPEEVMEEGGRPSRGFLASISKLFKSPVSDGTENGQP